MRFPGSDTTTTVPRSPRRPWVTLTSALMVVASTATTLLPWARSGRRSRSSYDLVSSADASGVVPDSFEGFVRGWYLVPIAAGTIIVLLALGARRSAGVGIASLGLVLGGFGAMVASSPLVPLLGARLGLVLGVGAVIWGSAVAVLGPRLDSYRSTP